MSDVRSCTSIESRVTDVDGHCLYILQDGAWKRQAKLLRESTDPISKIAMEVGYSNFSYFSKTFRDYVGSTPNEYRAKYRK